MVSFDLDQRADTCRSYTAYNRLEHDAEGILGRDGMTIGEVCNREVVFVNREVTVHAACKLMRHYHVGSLVVVDEAGEGPVRRVPAGVLTDRDVVIEVMAMDLDPKVITAGDIMSPELVTAPESMGVTEAIELMRSRGIRRLPIVNDENRLVGIVTIDDLLEVLAEELSGIARVVSREHMREGRVRK
jgi:CBS domain-containing protein